MKKSKKLLVVGLVLLGVAGFFIFNKKKKVETGFGFGARQKVKKAVKKQETGLILTELKPMEEIIEEVEEPDLSYTDI